MDKLDSRFRTRPGVSVDGNDEVVGCGFGMTATNPGRAVYTRRWLPAGCPPELQEMARCYNRLWLNGAFRIQAFRFYLRHGFKQQPAGFLAMFPGRHYLVRCECRGEGVT